MDWSKAKNILISALLITNLILIAAIYNSVSGSGGGDQTQIIRDTVLLLREHGIFVEEKLIPDRMQRLPVLSVRYRIVSQETVDQTLAESQIALPETASEDDYRRAAETLLKTAGIYSESCVYEGIDDQWEDKVIVRFGTEYEGYSLDNAKLYVTFGDGRVEEFSSSWAEPISMGQNRKQVMSAPTALVKFMTLQEKEDTPGEDIRIEEIRLVYWLEGYTDNGGVSEDTAAPYWCIRYNGDKSVYIAAYEE